MWSNAWSIGSEDSRHEMRCSPGAGIPSWLTTRTRSGTCGSRTSSSSTGSRPTVNSGEVRGVLRHPISATKGVQAETPGEHTLSEDPRFVGPSHRHRLAAGGEAGALDPGELHGGVRQRSAGWVTHRSRNDHPRLE